MATGEWTRLKNIAREMGYFTPETKTGAGQVKTAYEATWSKAAMSVEKQISSGEPLSKILSSWDNVNNLGLPVMNKVSGGVVQAVFREHGIKYKNAKDPVPYARVGVVNGRYNLVLNIDPVQLVRSAIHKGVEHVVEFGSGRGNNLFKVWSTLGANHHDIRFYALELTKAGRRTTELLASHPDARDMKISAHSFDLREPDISAVPDTGKAVFFSHHAVEQVEFNPRLYEMIAKRKSPSTVIHFEPVGWQRVPEIVEARRANDLNFYNALIARRFDDIGSEETQIVNQAINAWRMRYNTNLLEAVHGAASAGLCDIVNIHYDFTASNPVNPSTFIQLAFPNTKEAPDVYDCRNQALRTAGPLNS